MTNAYSFLASMTFKRPLQRNLKLLLSLGILLTFNMLMYLSWCANSSPERGHHAGKTREAETERNEETFLIVLILTGPKNFERRDAVRETWLSHMPGDVIRYFTLGTKGLTEEEMGTLEYENSLHGDLLLLPNLKDSYKELTEKVLQSFVWLDKHFKFKFVFKADDDSYARLEILVSELRLKQSSQFYWGFFDGRAKVKRLGQWAEPNWVLCDTYLPHALGGGYILSGDLVQYIAQNAKWLKKFNSEDVSVGTWLAPLDIQRVHDVRFDTEYKSRGCNNKYIVTHKQTIMDMKNKHTNMMEIGKMCAEEFRVRASYVYNWNTYASQCCIRNNTTIP